jgi:S-adenosylmethionine decarboxylase proenzyme
MGGHHIFGVLHGNVVLKHTNELVPLMEQVINELKLNEVSRAFHQFEPQGVTGVIVLSESHFSAHTYPEDDKVYLDLFCCSKDFKPDKASDVIMKIFGADLFQWDYVPR